MIPGAKAGSSAIIGLLALMALAFILYMAYNKLKQRGDGIDVYPGDSLPQEIGAKIPRPTGGFLGGFR